MKLNFIWDLDGVARDLSGEVSRRYGEGKQFSSFNDKIKGKTVVEWINEDLSILEASPTTEYYEVIKKYFPNPIFWSHQYEDWMLYTEKWLKKHFKDYTIELMDNKTKFEELSKLEDTYLVEDFPFYTSYKNMVLIDRLYNRDVKAPIRIKTPEELENFILKEKENGREKK